MRRQDFPEKMHSAIKIFSKSRFVRLFTLRGLPSLFTAFVLVYVAVGTANFYKEVEGI